jgi:hypothetical protein
MGRGIGDFYESHEVGKLGCSVLADARAAWWIWGSRGALPFSTYF